MKTESLTDFYLSYLDKLYANSIFKKKILSHQNQKYDSRLNEKELFTRILADYLEQAELTYSLIKNLNFSKKDALLEIGSGFGFTYGFLKKQGFDIYGLEPSDPSFEAYFDGAIEMFKIINIDKSNFYPISANKCEKLNKKFDIIFSNNVLEHIFELEETFSSLKNVLKPDGLMVHNTVNYFVPYEPHFEILLFPFFPRFTSFFKPSLKKSSLWNGLNFITTKKLKHICKSLDLVIKFKKDRLSKKLYQV